MANFKYSIEEEYAGIGRWILLSKPINCNDLISFKTRATVPVFYLNILLTFRCYLRRLSLTHLLFLGPLDLLLDGRRGSRSSKLSSESSNRRLRLLPLLESGLLGDDSLAAIYPRMKSSLSLLESSEEIKEERLILLFLRPLDLLRFFLKSFDSFALGAASSKYTE